LSLDPTSTRTLNCRSINGNSLAELLLDQRPSETVTSTLWLNCRSINNNNSLAELCIDINLARWLQHQTRH